MTAGNDHIVSQPPSLTFVNNAPPVYYLSASTPFDYGKKAGELMRNQILLLNLLERCQMKRLPMKNLLNNSENSETYQPFDFYSDELRGVSQAVHLPLVRLQALKRFCSHLFQGECTTTLSTGLATKDNTTFLTQNYDQELKSLRDFIQIVGTRIILTRFYWIADIRTMPYRYAYWGIPVFHEIPFFNEKGLGMGGNAILLTTNQSRIIDTGSGYSAYELERYTMMTCQNVTEVAQYWSTIERAWGDETPWPHFWDNSISLWCDREGGILMMEQTHQYHQFMFGNSTSITHTPEGILWHANHHQWLDPYLTGSVVFGENKKANSSYYRAARAHQLLLENYGNITLTVCEQITRDHQGGTDPTGEDSADICRHPDENLSSLTIFSWIINPEEMTVYWTSSSPCVSEFKKYDFSKIFPS